MLNQNQRIELIDRIDELRKIILDTNAMLYPINQQNYRKEILDELIQKTIEFQIDDGLLKRID